MRSMLAVPLVLAACGPAVDGAQGASSSSGEVPADSSGIEPMGATTTASATSSGDASSSSEGPSDAEGEDSGEALPCGNGVLDAEELCDDGNLEIGDGCNDDCRPGGELVWELAIDRDDGYRDLGFAVAVDSQDNIWVGGSTRRTAGGSVYAWLLVVTPDGEVVEDSLVDDLPLDATASWETIYAIAIDADDHGILVGTTTTGAAVLSRSRAGVLDWEYASSNASSSTSVALDPAGDVLVASSGAQYSGWITRLAGDGTPMWERSVASSAGLGYYALAVDADGAVFSSWFDGEAVQLRKYSSDLVELWSAPSAGEGLIAGLVIDAAGDVLTGGRVGYDTMELRDAKSSGVEGALQWEHGWSSAPKSEPSLSATQAVTVDAADRMVAAGFRLPANTGTTSAPFVRKRSADGDELWIYAPSFVADVGDTVNDVAIDSSQHIVVVGSRTLPDDASDPATDLWIAKLTP